MYTEQKTQSNFEINLEKIYIKLYELGRYRKHSTKCRIHCIT